MPSHPFPWKVWPQMGHCRGRFVVIPFLQQRHPRFFFMFVPSSTIEVDDGYQPSAAVLHFLKQINAFFVRFDAYFIPFFYVDFCERINKSCFFSS